MIIQPVCWAHHVPPAVGWDVDPAEEIGAAEIKQHIHQRGILEQYDALSDSSGTYEKWNSNAWQNNQLWL